MKRKCSIIEILIIICVIIMYFEGFLKEYSPNFGYIDELIIIILMCIYAFRLFIKKRISVYSLILIFNSILFLIIGVIGNSFSNYQSSKFAIFVDILSWQKFFLVFAILYDIIKDENIQKYTYIINKLAHLFIICGFFIYACIISGKIPLEYSRYGIKYLFLGGQRTSVFCMLVLCISNSNINE